MEKDNGGSAFPSHGTMGEVVQEGMTLRDYFAAKAMAALISQGAEVKVKHPEGYITKTGVHGIPSVAYLYADAMIAERAK